MFVDQFLICLFNQTHVCTFYCYYNVPFWTSSGILSVVGQLALFGNWQKTIFNHPNQGFNSSKYNLSKLIYFKTTLVPNTSEIS